MKEMIAAISLLYSIPVGRIVSLKDEKVFWVYTKKERLVLKLLPYPAGETGFITDAMNYLSQNGFHRFNEPIPTAAGKLWGKFHGQCTLLTKEIHGRVPSYRKKEDVAAVASYIGELHNAAAHFFPLHRYPERIKWGTLIQTMGRGRNDLIELQSEISQKRELNEFDTVFLRHCPHYIRETERAMTALSEFYPRLSEEKRKLGGFCHHDPAYHNFHIRSDGEVGAFDFDYAIADPAAHDVAALLLKVLKTNHWNPALAFCALQGYRQSHPLDDDELRLIYWMLYYPYDFHHAAFARYRENNRQHRIEKKLLRLEREGESRSALLRTLSSELPH